MTRPGGTDVARAKRGWPLTAAQQDALVALLDEHGVAFVNEVYPDGGAQIVTQDTNDRQRVYGVEQDGTTALVVTGVAYLPPSWARASRGARMSTLADIAPRLARAQEQERQERGITRCWQNSGYHVYVGGPCFDTLEEAIAYRDRLDAKGVTWLRQPRF